MKDYLRENLSYIGLYRSIRKVKKKICPEHISFGKNKQQYYLYYEPIKRVSDKIVFWVHGGGWNSKSPEWFDFVGQCVAAHGYRMISAGYRLSPKHKYPCQIKDVCDCFNAAVKHLESKGIDTSQIVAAGPSAGAHLSSLLCYSKAVQKKYSVDISRIIGFVGSGGPYSFRKDQTRTLKMLEDLLFAKGYDRRKGEPVSMMGKNHIPMLLIQSRHDGLIGFECAQDFKQKADRIGNVCNIYSVSDKKDTHSWYTAGMFAQTRQTNIALDTFFLWIERLGGKNEKDDIHLGGGQAEDTCAV